jgi:heparanase
MELRPRRRLLLLLALICLRAPRLASAQQPDEATVIVKGSTRIAETDDNYVCATIDWWPPEKCNYNQCPWGQASILNLVYALCLFSFSCYWWVSVTQCCLD